MSDFIKCFRVEFLKLRRTLALWAVPIAPLLIAVVYGMVLLAGRANNGGEPWKVLFHNTTTIWSVILLPMYITLQTALLAQIENSSGQWRRLMALPVSHSTVYLAKWCLGMLLTLGGFFFLWGFTILEGLLMRLLLPAAGFGAPIPWTASLQMMGVMVLTCVTIVSVHTWVGLRWHNFAAAAGFGIVATMGNVLASHSMKWVQFYPWTLPYASGQENVNLTIVLLIGTAAGIILAVLGTVEFSNREVTD